MAFKIAPQRMLKASTGQTFMATVFSRRIEIAWLTAAVGIGLILRVYFMTQPMRYDESLAYLYFANRGFWDMFFYPLPNNHVFHTLMVRLCTEIFGHAPSVIRLPAFLFGLASIPLAFAVCRELHPRPTGLMTALLTAVFPYLVLYSTMARGYAVIVFLTLALTLTGLRASADPTPTKGFATGLIAALGLFTVPSMLFPVAGLYLWIALLVFGREKGLTTATLKFFACGITTTVAVTLALYTPVLMITGGLEPIVANRFVRGLPWVDFFLQLGPHFRLTLRDFSRNVSWPLLLVGGVFFCTGLLRVARDRSRPALLLLPSLFFGSAVVLLAKHSIPFARTWIYILPFLFIYIDIGAGDWASRLPSKVGVLFKPAGVLLAAVACAVMIRHDTIAAYPDTGRFPEAERVVRYLETVMRPDDELRIGVPADGPVYYYMIHYAVPRKGQTATPAVAAEYFIVQKSAYTVEQMTSKAVEKLFEFGDAAVYRSREAADPAPAE